MKKLIVVTMLILSSNVFADVYSDYEQRRYNQEMLKQQQEQTKLLRQQAVQQQEALSEQRLHDDNEARQYLYGRK